MCMRLSVAGRQRLPLPDCSTIVGRHPGRLYCTRLDAWLASQVTGPVSVHRDWLRDLLLDVLYEEWEHRRYAERDLAVLEAQRPS
jgi:hypothetical protein